MECSTWTDSLPTRDGVSSWQFLCGVADRRTLAFHGTGDPDIESFEPRKPIDFAPFGDQTAVFATSDPIWAMFYAIVDRDRYPLTLNNACIFVTDQKGVPIDRTTTSRSAATPWAGDPGEAAILDPRPAETLRRTATGNVRRSSCPRASTRDPVAGLDRSLAWASLRATSRSWTQIRGHDDDWLAEYAEAVMAAAPWPDEPGLSSPPSSRARRSSSPRRRSAPSARRRSATWRRRRGSPGR